MGQRANYILIENNTQAIYYNHWRANCITSDLYLGEARFIEFARSCEQVKVMLNEVWMEGCVVINIDEKTVHFWSLEYEVTFATGFYMEKLRGRWNGWTVDIAYNRMYDIERILNIDYTSKQDLSGISTKSKKEILNDEFNDWASTVTILKTADKIHISQTGAWVLDGILNFGESVVNVLREKRNYELPVEKDMTPDCILIDITNCQILINKSDFGLWEQTAAKWPGYSFKMGDFGYIGFLELVGVDIRKLTMSPEKVQEEFAQDTKYSSGFDAFAFAESLITMEKDVKFNVNFFDNKRPKQTLPEKIKSFINQLKG